MKKENLKSIALDIFSRYPNEKKVHVTSDGQAFFDRHYASMHAQKNRGGKEMSIEEFSRSDVNKSPEINTQERKTAKQIVADLNEVTLEEVEAIIEEEKTSESPRTTVIKAAEKRLSELQESEEL